MALLTGSDNPLFSDNCPVLAYPSQCGLIIGKKKSLFSFVQLIPPHPTSCQTICKLSESFLAKSLNKISHISMSRY